MSDRINLNILGESLTLELGHQRSTPTGKMLHPLLRAVRVFGGNPVHQAAVVSAALMLCGAVFFAGMYAPSAVHSVAESLAGKKQDVAIVVAEPAVLEKEVATEKPILQATAEPASAQQTVQITAASAESNSPLPPGGLPAVPLPIGTEAIVVGAQMPTPYPMVATAPRASEQKASTPKAAIAKTAPQASEVTLPASMLIYDGTRAAAAAASPSDIKPDTAIAGGAGQEVEEPDLAKAFVPSKPGEKQPSKRKIAELKDKPDAPKTAPAVKMPPLQQDVAQVAPKKRDAEPVAKSVKAAQWDDDESNYPQPIREKVVGGRGQGNATASSQQMPTETAPQSVKPAVEILALQKDAAIVTNPETNLPVRVAIGGKLPNGDLLQRVDSENNTISTNNGTHRME